jgi:hypothetical protein
MWHILYESTPPPFYINLCTLGTKYYSPKKYGDYLEAVHGSLGRYICNEKSFSCMSYLFSQFFKSSSHFVEEGWASSRGRP